MPTKLPRKFWIALQTEYQSEATAARSIAPIVIETYNALYRERAKRGVRRVLPVLQGYLLARIDRRATQLGEVARGKGVRGIVGAVGDAEVLWLRSLEGSDGYVTLGEHEPPAFAFGESVLALSGSFRDQNGEYLGLDHDNQRRARVAFEILGRMVEQSIPRYDLARVA